MYDAMKLSFVCSKIHENIHTGKKKKEKSVNTCSLTTVCGVWAGFVCDISENVHMENSKNMSKLQAQSVISNIGPCVFKAWPWTAISAPQLKQEGPVRSPL